MADPFDDFGDQQFSHDLVEHNRDTLRQEACDLMEQHPGVEPVGLILDAQVPEARPFMEAFEKAIGKKLDVPGFLGVVPRPFAVEILRQSQPAALDNLPNGQPGISLPVLVAMKSGFRFAEVGLAEV